jgi:molybdopterin-guanine dinucleotide biosynthesis protein B
MVGIAGFSGSGKTTVTVGLVAEFNRRGLRVATIKHDVHGFAIDRPGKDSWRHKQAGAAATIVTSPDKIGMVMDADHDHQPWELLPLLSGIDLVLVEGFKRAPIAKIEVHRPETGKPPACRNDPNLIAVVSDADLHWGVPRFGSRDVSALADFIAARFDLAVGHGSLCRKAACQRKVYLSILTRQR